MAHVILIPGCGEMVCSTFEEMSAAIDRAHAQPKDHPLPTEAALASLAPALKPIAIVRPTFDPAVS